VLITDQSADLKKPRIRCSDVFHKDHESRLSRRCRFAARPETAEYQRHCGLFPDDSRGRIVLVQNWTALVDGRK
jgi:hypothetical protein